MRKSRNSTPGSINSKVPGQKLLEVKGLTKVFTKGQGLVKSTILAVNNVSFSLQRDQAEIFTVAGESGSGKSTVAKLILGFEIPTAGQILYKGQELSTLRGKKQFMQDVQPVFQNPFETFNPLKKVESYFLETEKNFARPGAAKKCLELVGLSMDEIGGKYPSEMSGGQLQRASIARALITNPSLLIVDEPVSMIDASLRMSVINLFKKFQEEQGVSILYITHDLATAYYVSDRIAIMLRGQIVEIGSVKKVLDEPLHPYTQLLKSSVPVPDPAEKWTSDIALSDMEAKEYVQKGCKFAGRCPHVKELCRIREPDYYEVDGRSVKCYIYEKGWDQSA
ncbi:MAG: ABC transporter ATP-binding protein [Bacillota bacterium]|jgi:peptide/nickel transport system ATP-binding protein|nr:ABC transporter ATP-binding protein [Bacillota bacterium]